MQLSQEDTMSPTRLVSQPKRRLQSRSETNQREQRQGLHRS